MNDYGQWGMGEDEAMESAAGKGEGRRRGGGSNAPGIPGGPGGGAPGGGPEVGAAVGKGAQCKGEGIKRSGPARPMPAGWG